MTLTRSARTYRQWTATFDTEDVRIDFQRFAQQRKLSQESICRRDEVLKQSRIAGETTTAHDAPPPHKPSLLTHPSPANKAVMKPTPPAKMSKRKRPKGRTLGVETQSLQHEHVLQLARQRRPNSGAKLRTVLRSMSSRPSSWPSWTKELSTEKLLDEM